MKQLRFTVAKKLYLGFIIVLLFMVILGLASVVSMNNINDKTKEVTTSWLPGVEAINKISYLTEHISSLEYEYTFTLDKSESAALEEEMNKTLSEINETLDKYEATIYLEEDRKNFDELKEKWAQYEQLHSSFLQIGSNMDIINGAGELSGIKLSNTIRKANELFDEMHVNLDFLIQLNNEGASKASDEGNKIFENAFTLLIIVTISAIIIGLTIAYIISRMISNPLKRITSNVKEVANGVLTIEPVMIKNKDELGELANSFNDMTKNVKNLIREITQTSEAVASSSEELLASSEQTSRATEQITVAIQEVASGTETQLTGASSAEQSVKEIAKGMVQVANSIHTVSDLSMTTNQKAEKGLIVVEETVKQMGYVQENVTKTSTIIHGLSERSKEIGNIIDIISSVSEQTNLLALNAAIEAARAGEHGKGFAVVADEVRKLAEESSKATDNIRTLIKHIQEEITQVNASMDEGTDSVKSGIEKVSETGKSFNEIAQMIEGITSQAQEVSAIVEEVNASTEDMVQMISSIATISKQSAGNTQNVAAAAEEQNASMEEIAASADALSHMAQELQHNISQFKI